MFTGVSEGSGITSPTRICPFVEPTVADWVAHADPEQNVKWTVHVNTTVSCPIFLLETSIETPHPQYTPLE